MALPPFNETPSPPVRSTRSGSINTTELDPYRQGVELTLDRFFQLGPVKIHAGEPGHQLRQNQVGEPAEITYTDVRFFQEIDVFDPVRYMTNNVDPIHLSDFVAFRASTTADGYNYDGIIEPLTIRSIVTFQSINESLEPHSVHGSLESANFNAFVYADRVVAVQRFDERTLGSFPFEDNVDSINNIPINIGFFPIETRRVQPFDDSQLKSGHVVSGSMGLDIQIRLAEMSPESDNYVPFGYISSTTGWDD